MHSRLSALALSLSGFIALAVAMGIGRFAFTPLLPMMQRDAGLGLAEGGWLASANYLGYLVGALITARIPWTAGALLRAGLVIVVAMTALMGITETWFAWMIWRFAAGAASALVLVSTSSLCLARLALLGQSNRAGLVFAGVGCGIALAGLLCMALDLIGASSSSSWLLLGVAALIGTIAARRLWQPQDTPMPVPVTPRPYDDGAAPSPAAPQAAQSSPRANRAQQMGMVLCYGLFGFGYILPATFLPAQARLLVPDPAFFGLAWPLFGLAAALSTVLTSRFFAALPRRRVWAASQLIMAVGVLLPVLWSSLASIVVAAICVGGTFMVITMLAMQEAQAMAAGQARRLMAAMTAAFAVGQLAGPVFFSLTHRYFDASLNFALIMAAVGLALSGLFLLKLKEPGN